MNGRWPTFLNSRTKQLCIDNGRLIKGSKPIPLFSQGETADHFFLVLSGAVKLIKSLENSKTKEPSLVDIVGPADFIALLLMIDQGETKYPVSAIPLGTVEVLEIPKQFFKQIWSKDSELMAHTFILVQQKMNRIQSDRCLQRMPLDKRVAHMLTEKIAPIKNIKITRQEIADCVGSTQESIIRLLSIWTKKNWLSTINQEIEIHELEKLRALWKS
jgi:CRP-like cAMP-binding protein